MSIHLMKNPVVSNLVAKLYRIPSSSSDYRRFTLTDIGMLLFYEVIEHLQTQPEEINSDKVVTRLFPNAISSGTFDENQLVVAIKYRHSVSLLAAVAESLPNALTCTADGNLDERHFKPAKSVGDSSKRRPKTTFRFQDKVGIVADTMLDSGEETSETLYKFKAKGVSKIILVSVFSSPEGLERISAEHPDVEIFTASIADAKGLIDSI